MISGFWGIAFVFAALITISLLPRSLSLLFFLAFPITLLIISSSLSACYACLIKCTVFLPTNKPQIEIAHIFCSVKKTLLSDLGLMRAQCCISSNRIRTVTGRAVQTLTSS